MKRFIKILILASATITTLAFAAVPPAPVAPNPIIDTTPYAGDARNVVVFFKFSCPVCRNYHMALDYWGRSLPKPLTFQFVPVIEGDTHSSMNNDAILASMMFWSVERAGTASQKASFADAAYGITQDSHSQSLPKSWIGAIAETGITKPQFTSALATESKGWAGRIGRQAHYQPTATPTLVICGKWMITPDSTNGNQEMFMQLASGLVSKCMVEQGIPH